MHALGFTQGVHGGQVFPQVPEPLSPWEVGVAGLTRSRKGHLLWGVSQSCGLSPHPTVLLWLRGERTAPGPPGR